MIGDGLINNFKGAPSNMPSIVYKYKWILLWLREKLLDSARRGGITEKDLKDLSVKLSQAQHYQEFLVHITNKVFKRKNNSFW